MELFVLKPLGSLFSPNFQNLLTLLFQRILIADDQLMSLCLDLFMAGAETTSNTLGFAMQLMVLHPDIQRKVQKEMDEVIGRNRLPCLNDRMRYGKIKKLLKILDVMFLYLESSYLEKMCLPTLGEL